MTSLPSRGDRVYPRACGGARLDPAPGIGHAGLSPRVRGSPVSSPPRSDGRGSIPARAGEPRPAADGNTPYRVYPRACGGAHQVTVMLSTYPGLSPRVRGSPLVEMVATAAMGSIPARAGEPHKCQPRRRPLGVYPRACGGARIWHDWHRPTRGLSPRVRGSHKWLDYPTTWAGSIPARAGEPGQRDRIKVNRGVYPRACGGALRHWLP